MLCPKCGHYSENEENVCPECGELLKRNNEFKDGGAQAIRQGKRAREAAKARPVKAPEATERQRRRRDNQGQETPEMGAVPDTRSKGGPGGGRAQRTGRESEDGEDVPGGRIERKRRPVYENRTEGEGPAPYAPGENGNGKRRMVNWIKLSLIGMAAAVVLVAIAYVVYTQTWFGELFRARHDQKASAAAYWAVGDERMDVGDISGAIRSYEKAAELDAENKNVDVDGLLMLASAYESMDDTKKAAELYEKIYTETPSRTEAYVNHIRILQNSGKYGDLAKAGELMKLAYEKTGDTTFETQRNDLLPSPPKLDPIAAYYEKKINVTFTSYQGYDIYYTLDEKAKLPYGGKKAPEEGLPLDDEGVYYIRAVCVNGELVSDEVAGTYKVIMPSPQIPRATLAPNTYKTPQKVRLKPGVDDEKDTNLVIYYTVDGSIPDSDSPIFTGDPITLPNGWVSLKAIAVNRYNKLSNMLEVKYKIEANPKPKSSFTAEDTISGLKLTQTTQNEFFEKFGEGTPVGAVTQEGFETECRRFDYSWGYAVMNLNKKKIWVLVEISYSAGSTFSGPRGTGIGDAEAFVTEKFKDMQQIASKSGNRGLYSNNDGTGKIWKQENGEKIIRYRYDQDGHWIQLEYLLNTAGNVKNIDWKYIP